MDDTLYFTEQHHQVREMVREFSQERIAPVARELDRTSEFPWENIKAMGELGLLGVPWSEELGGAGMDQLSYYITIHEMAKVDASHALTISAHTNLGTSPIVEFGTEEQKRRYVPLLASGKVLGGFGLTEPGAGSDAGGTATTAVDKGDHYLLNGSKIFITHAGVGRDLLRHRADRAGQGQQGHHQLHRDQGHRGPRPVPRARRGPRGGPAEDPGRPRRQEGGQDGLARERHPRAGASRTRSCPRRTSSARPGQGFVNFLKTLDAGRIGIAALSLGIAEGAYEEALRYAGRPEAVRPLHRQLPGRAASSSPTWPLEIEAGTHLLYHAAWLKQNGKPFKKEAAMAKLYCSELAMRATTKAVQIFGGYGYTTEYPVERMMRDAKVCEIGEGTSEIQRIVIARQILGEVVD